jgi:CRP/FNR family transcriptional regulator, cyclic AMP receptor protein
LDASQLKSIPLFQEVSDEELAEIAPFAEETTVEDGTELVREGDFSYEFFAIQDGQAEVTRGGEKVAELGPGDFFGEIGVLERDLRTASVVAKTDMSLVTLTGWDMKRMDKAMPHAVERVRQVLEQRRSGS